MAWVLYHNFLLTQEDGTTPVDLNTDALTMALTTASYVPAAATDTVWSGISANEVSGTNYTAGGTAITGATATMATGTFTFDIDNVTWLQHASGFSNARYVVIKRTSDGRLIAYHDFGSSKGNVTGDFTVEIDAAGVFTKAAA